MVLIDIHSIDENGEEFVLTVEEGDLTLELEDLHLDYDRTVIFTERYEVDDDGTVTRPWLDLWSGRG